MGLHFLRYFMFLCRPCSPSLLYVHCNNCSVKKLHQLVLILGIAQNKHHETPKLTPLVLFEHHSFARYFMVLITSNLYILNGIRNEN